MLAFVLLDVVWWVGSVALGGVAGWLVALFEYETDDGQVLMAVLLGLAGAFVFVATQVSWRSSASRTDAAWCSRQSPCTRRNRPSPMTARNESNTGAHAARDSSTTRASSAGEYGLISDMAA